MKETVGSLQRYFSLIGFLGGLGSLFSLQPIWHVFNLPGVAGLLKLMVAFYGLCGLAQALICLAFVYFARNLPKLLRDQPSVIVSTLMASMGISVVGFAAGAYLTGILTQNVMILVAGIAISYYLMTQVKRLSKVAREENGPAPVA